MREDYIEDNETLYRAIPDNPNFWKVEQGRPSSALFKDSNGASVDRDGGRDESEILQVFASRMPTYGLASITALACRECAAHPVPKPEPDNEYHAEIHDSKEKIQISSGKARKLSKKINVLKKPSNVE